MCKATQFAHKKVHSATTIRLSPRSPVLILETHARAFWFRMSRSPSPASAKKDAGLSFRSFRSERQIACSSKVFRGLARGTAGRAFGLFRRPEGIIGPRSGMHEVLFGAFVVVNSRPSGLGPRKGGRSCSTSVDSDLCFSAEQADTSGFFGSQERSKAKGEDHRRWPSSPAGPVTLRVRARRKTEGPGAFPRLRPFGSNHSRRFAVGGGGPGKWGREGLARRAGLDDLPSGRESRGLGGAFGRLRSGMAGRGIGS